MSIKFTAVCNGCRDDYDGLTDTKEELIELLIADNWTVEDNICYCEDCSDHVEDEDFEDEENEVNEDE